MNETQNPRSIYRFFVDYGRGFDLEGTFSASKSDIDLIVGKTVHFGEVCGKHSDMEATMDEDCITLLCDDPAVVAAFDKFGFASGLNPVVYYREAHEDEDEDEG